jgi:hypothetical protein
MGSRTLQAVTMIAALASACRLSEDHYLGLTDGDAGADPGGPDLDSHSGTRLKLVSHGPTI